MSQSYVDQAPFSFKASYASIPTGYQSYDPTKSYDVGTKVYYRSKGYTINTAVTGTTGATGTVDMSAFATTDSAPPVPSTASMPTRLPQITVAGVSNIQMWYDASDPLNTGNNPVSLINEAIPNWHDKTQYNIINAIQKSNTNPIVLNSDSFGYYLKFMNNSYNIGNGLGWIYNTFFTIFIVETPNYTCTPNNYLYLLGQVAPYTTGNNILSICYKCGSGSISSSINFGNGTVLATYAIDPISTNNRIWSFTFTTGNLLSIYLNGSSKASATASGYFNNPVIYGNIGSGLSCNVNYNGNIREIIGYKGSINTADRQAIENYLIGKWGNISTTTTTTTSTSTSTSTTTSTSTSTTTSTTTTTTSTTTTTTTSTTTTTTTLPPRRRPPPGAALWLDGMDPNNNGSIPTANSSLATWVDKSTSAKSVTIQNNFPTWNSNNVSLDGSTQRYETNYTSGSSIENGFIVFTPSSSATQISVLIATTSAGGRQLRYDPAGKIELWTGSGSIFTQTSTNTAMLKGKTILYSYCYDKSAGINSLYSYVNGSSISITTNATTLATITEGTTQIGAVYSGATWFNGTISEIIIFNTTLSNTDRQGVEGYLAWKWGLNMNLPTTHPYKNSRLNKTGLGLWLDGMDPNNNGSKPTANSSLATWVDKSGITPPRSTIVRANTSSPIWNADTISLDGSTQFYASDYTSGSSIENGFIVFTPSSSTTQISALIATDSPEGRQLRYDPAGKIELWTGTGSIFTQTSTNTAMLKGKTILYNYCYDKTAGVTSLYSYVNGSPVTITTSGVTLSTISGGITQLGAVYSGPVWFNGTISEIMIFNTTLSNTDRQAVEGYLAWKWGLNTTLPTTHPYSTNRLTMGGGGSNIIVPKIIYDNNNKQKNKANHITQTYMSGGGVILNPASYALEQ